MLAAEAVEPLMKTPPRLHITPAASSDRRAAAGETMGEGPGTTDDSGSPLTWLIPREPAIGRPSSVVRRPWSVVSPSRSPLEEEWVRPRLLAVGAGDLHADVLLAPRKDVLGLCHQLARG